MRHLAIITYVRIINSLKSVLLLSDVSMKVLFVPGFARLRNFNGKARAYKEFKSAKKNVPAYRSFINANNFSKLPFNSITPNINTIPFTDKENYVKKYSLEARCVYGKIPSKEVVIDESSGSSGTATNWARGKKERTRNARFIKFGIRNLFGNKPLFVINAFAMGPWATGVNITMSCIKFSRLKSLGPDKLKIENTLKHFSVHQNYLIMGYPPFLKMLVDTIDINWREYNVSLIFGGESMSEGMRDYLIEKGIKKIYSSFGASDIELNIAAENDFTISLRRLMRSNKTLREKILKFSGALPMVFQFNPADFLIESNKQNELLITVCRSGYIAPKIRYNIHDKGHILSIKELYKILGELQIDLNQLVQPATDLPLLFHYGRNDMTVSFFGSNISPVDIHEVLFNIPELTHLINSFHLCVLEDEQGNKILNVDLETQQNKDISTIDVPLLQQLFFEELAKINQDFREANRMAANPELTTIHLHNFNCGPFRDSDIRIKARYVN